MIPKIVERTRIQVSDFVHTFQHKHGEDAKRAQVKQFKFRFAKKDTHFVERIIERGVNKGRYGTILKSLFDKHYCELLYLEATTPKDFTIGAYYKDIVAIFRIRKEDGIIIPITVMLKNKINGIDVDYEINVGSHENKYRNSESQSEHHSSRCCEVEV